MKQLNKTLAAVAYKTKAAADAEAAAERARRAGLPAHIVAAKAAEAAALRAEADEEFAGAKRAERAAEARRAAYLSPPTGLRRARLLPQGA